MKTSLFCFLLILTTLLCLHSQGADPTLKTETFDSDPSWEGHRNHIVPKAIPTITQDFGYSTTNFAGKAAGEIGGQLHRAAEAAFYGAKIAPKTLDDKLSASGSIAFTKTSGNSGLFFGWFNGVQPGGSGRPVASLGMNFDCEPKGGRLAVFVITAQNQVNGKFITRYEKYRTPEERAVQRPTPIKNDGTRYHWKLDYDPAANGGNGQIQFSIKSDSAQPDEFEGKTVTADLPPGFKKQGTTFDHFGMMNLLKDGAPLTVHLDDLSLDGESIDFAKDPGWDGSGNHASYQAKEVGGAHDFGFRPTNRAGGATGELGGIAWRGPYAYYGDRVGPLTLNDRLEARGRMFFEGAGLDAGLRIGWFNSEGKEVDDRAPVSRNFVGVDIGGHTRVGHWFLPSCLTSKGDRHFDDKGNVLLKAGTAYEWSVVYDPAANAGHGQMKVTLGGETATLDLGPSAKEQGVLLDRFGLTTVGTGGGQVKLYLDDLQYSAGKAHAAASQVLPKVVLLGDSIREGYAPFVAELLEGKAIVVTPTANGRDTGTLLTNLGEWAVKEQPDVIHFNCGIHDTKRNKETLEYNVPPAQYETNLREIVKRLRAETKAKIVFALSTPPMDERSQEAWKTRSYRLEQASVAEYNVIALRVMKELGVPVNDLPAALGNAEESARLHDAGGVHFTKEGSERLAAAVVTAVKGCLPDALH